MPPPCGDGTLPTVVCQDRLCPIRAGHDVGLRCRDPDRGVANPTDHAATPHHLHRLCDLLPGLYGSVRLGASADAVCAMDGPLFRAVR